jgi:hypothetical protein
MQKKWTTQFFGEKEPCNPRIYRGSGCVAIPSNAYPVRLFSQKIFFIAYSDDSATLFRFKAPGYSD